MKKTNAMRLLEAAHLPYTPCTYPVGDGALDGLSVAEKTGQSPARVFKTLVLQSPGEAIYVFCLPVCRELPLKSAAAAAGEKSLALLPLDKLLALTGYRRGGCSPVGMKKKYPCFLEQSALSHASILVSGGEVGLQIEIAPKNLIAAIQATLFALP